MARAKAAKPKVTASDVRAALRVRFAAPAWAYFDEVGNGTGIHCSRHADGVAMSLWPSRGLELHGVEIKVSRADWLKELAQPKKADDICKFMDRWWITVGDEAIVQPGELPPTWGLLVYRADKLVAKVEAPKLTPEPLSRVFIAALLRRASEGQQRVRREGFAEGYEKGKGAGPEEHQAALAAVQRELKHLQDAVAKFEQDSGIKLGDWRFGDAGAAVKALLDRRHVDAADRLRQVAQQLENTVHYLRDDAKQLDKQREVSEQFQLQVQERGS